MRRKGNPSALLVGMQIGEATVENSMEFPQKTKNGIAFDPAIPLLVLYPKNPETPIQKNLCIPMFTAAQFTIAKYWKQPKCPSANEWIQKAMVHLHNGILHSREKEGVLYPLQLHGWNWRALCSEITQVVRDKYHVISPLTGI